jgi:hypothetical protein
MARKVQLVLASSALALAVGIAQAQSPGLPVTLPADVADVQVLAPGAAGTFGFDVRNPGAEPAGGFVTAQFSWQDTDGVDVLAEYAFVPESGSGCAPPQPDASGFYIRLRFDVGVVAPGATRACRYRVTRSLLSRNDLAFSVCQRTGESFCGRASLYLGSLPDLRLQAAPETGDPALLRLTVVNDSGIALQSQDVATECLEYEGGLLRTTPIDVVNDFPGACPTGSAGGATCVNVTGINAFNRAFRIGPLPPRGSASCLVRIRATGAASDEAVSVFFNPDPLSVAGGGSAFDANRVNDDTLLGAPVSSNRRSFTGGWYEQATSGQGFVLEVYPSANGAGQVFGGWFTHSADGSATRWYSVQGAAPADASSASLTIYANYGGNFASGPATSAARVGSATLSFFNCAEANLTYRFDDGSAQGAIVLGRLFGGPCALDRAFDQAELRSGAWFDPATSGQGLTLEIAPPNARTSLFAAWYTYVPDGAQVGGPDSQRWYSLQGSLASSQSTSAEVEIFETRGGRFDQPTPRAQASTLVGTGRIDFGSCTALRLDYAFTGGASAGRSGTLQLQRTGPVPAGCR